MWEPRAIARGANKLLLNRLNRRGQVGPIFHHLLQPLQPGLEVGVFGLDLPVLLLQRLDRDHQDACHVAGVDGRRSPDSAHTVISKGGKEILGQ